jgi:hypothetical protein
MTHKNRKKVKKFHAFEVLECSLLRYEGFSCSLDVLYGGLGISKLQFDKKKSAVNFVQFLVIKTLGPNPKPESMNPDPKR